MDPGVSTKLLWNYFEGKSTPAQKQILLDWLKSRQNQELFFDVLHEWEKANPQIMLDMSSDWNDILLKINNEGVQKHEISQESETLVKRSRKVWYRLAAASVSLVFLAGFWQRDLLMNKTYEAGYGETKSFLLDDGSRVTLNADSKLTYPRFGWLQKNREVNLAGEAEFSVVHTTDHRPFVVKTSDQLEVRVLGTEFMVYSRKQESKVVLTSGKVRLRSLKNDAPPINIKPGDVVVVNRRGDFQLKREEKAADHLAWKDHRFLFNRTSLAEVAMQIQERFGVVIQIPDSSLAATRLSGYYPAENADEMIQMIVKLLNVRVEKLADKTLRITED